MKRLILDASFVRSQSKQSNAIRSLLSQGNEFVVPDRLIYELCTAFPNDARRSSRLLAKLGTLLADCPDHVWVYSPVGRLVEPELRLGKPNLDPVDDDATWHFRGVIRGAIQPPRIHKMREQVSIAYQQDDVEQPNRFRSVFGQMFGSSALKELRKEIPRSEWTEMGTYWCAWDSPAVDEMYSISYGSNRPKVRKLWRTPARHVVDVNWMTATATRCQAAVQLEMIRRAVLGSQAVPKDYVNTLHDSDYVASLHFADAIATRETKGLAMIREWIWGESRPAVDLSLLQ